VNVTATLIGQIVTFAVLVWFIQRFLWGPLTALMEDRKKRIADGLAAAERGQHEQQLAEERAKEALHAAKEQAAGIIAQAQKRAAEIVDEAKDEARSEGERLLAAARAEIDHEYNQAKEQLRAQVVSLAVAGAEKVLEQEIDAQTHTAMLDKLAAEI
jgi:F-type H+-transporting ATPase subunit b